MFEGKRITVIIPMLNEADAIQKVLADIPEWVDEVITVDNGSTDDSIKQAEEAGARVLEEPVRGYGKACLTGIAAANNPDIIVFIDGDYSDYPEEMDSLVRPIVSGEAEMVIGSRVLGEREKGALTPQARFGNWLSCLLIRWIWGYRFTDLGPFRAIRFDSLKRMKMRDENYGWTVEMQIKAARLKIPSLEVPVRYRKRIGKSKVSGTVKGVVLAGSKILWTIFRAALSGSKV
ncbi:MAG: glycosyltransferase family 2 protein [Calditrichia bacterium]